jgi:hypothetical protein
MVPNPYTLLSLIPVDATVFTCLDLQDAFFCIRLALRANNFLPFNGMIQKMEKGNIPLDQTASRFQKLSDGLWTSAGLKPKEVSSWTDWMHNPTICG